MEFGTVRIGAVGPRFSGAPSEDLSLLFTDPPEGPEAAESAFGVLDVLTGHVGSAGPGFAVRVPLHTELEAGIHEVELRVRAHGRYVRTRVKGWADRHGDLRVSAAANPVVHAYVPYAVLPTALTELVLEVWLVERLDEEGDPDPIEEALYSFAIPGDEVRRLENALTAVVLALVSTTAAPTDEGLAASGLIESAVTDLFDLDVVGRAWAAEIVSDALPESERAVATRLRAHLSHAGLGAVLAVLKKFARTARGLAFVGALTTRLGVEPGKPPRTVPPSVVAHYATLGLTPSATRDEVREAFHLAAAAHHPDRVPEAGREAATVAMMRLNAAYAALRKR